MGWLNAAKTIALVVGGSIAGIWITIAILGNTWMPDERTASALMYVIIYTVGGVVPAWVVIPVMLHRHHLLSKLDRMQIRGVLPVLVTVVVLAAWSVTNIPTVLSTVELYHVVAELDG